MELTGCPLASSQMGPDGRATGSSSARSCLCPSQCTKAPVAFVNSYTPDGWPNDENDGAGSSSHAPAHPETSSIKSSAIAATAKRKRGTMRSTLKHKKHGSNHRTNGEWPRNFLLALPSNETNERPSRLEVIELRKKRHLGGELANCWPPATWARITRLAALERQDRVGTSETDGRPSFSLSQPDVH